MTRRSRLSTPNRCHTYPLQTGGIASLLVKTFPNPHTVARLPFKSPTSCTSNKLGGSSISMTVNRQRHNILTIMGQLANSFTHVRTRWPSGPIPHNQLRASLAEVSDSQQFLRTRGMTTPKFLPIILVQVGNKPTPPLPAERRGTRLLLINFRRNAFVPNQALIARISLLPALPLPLFLLPTPYIKHPCASHTAHAQIFGELHPMPPSGPPRQPTHGPTGLTPNLMKFRMSGTLMSSVK